MEYVIRFDKFNGDVMCFFDFSGRKVVIAYHVAASRLGVCDMSFQFYLYISH